MSITNCNFNKNNVTRDAGVNYNDWGYMNITNCNFTQNNAQDGGVNYNFGNMNIINSNFNKNNVTRDGGVNYSGDNINITNCNFTQNNAKTKGGVNRNNDNMNITNSNFNENTVENKGGVNYNEGKMNITNSNFTQNNATRGGVNYNEGKMINITNSNFNKNNAKYRGGVNYNYESNMTIINSNFNENNAIEDGGVNFIYNGNLYINNSSFLNNFDKNNIVIYSNKLFIMGNSSIINTLDPLSTNINITLRSPIFITSLNDDEKIEFTLNNKTQITTKNTTNNFVQITELFKEMRKQTVDIKYPSFNDNNTIKLEIPVIKLGIQNSKLENKTMKIHENYTMNLIINDTEGNPIVGNLSCAVKINGVTQLHTKTENEKLTFTLNTENFSAKTYNITIIIGETSYYNKGIITQTLIIQNRPVDMEITTNTPKTATENLYINVKLTEEGKPVEGGFVIIFKINGVTLKDKTGQQIRVNVTNGSAKLNYTIPNTIGTGKYNMTCVYNKKYYNARDTINFTIEREVIPTKTMKIHENYTMNLIIKDIEGNPIVGNLSCAVKINGVTQLHTKTENEKLTFTLNTENFSAKTYNITIVIGGNSHYDKKIITQTLIIQNRPVDMEITTNTPKTTENLDVNVKLTENGNTVEGGFVIFKINGVTLKDKTGQQIRVNVTNGSAKLNYTLPNTIGAGKYNITCVYNKKYYNARDTVNFTIEQKDNTEIYTKV